MPALAATMQRSAAKHKRATRNTTAPSSVARRQMPSVRALTRATAAGDSDALGLLYEQWFDFSLRVASRLTRRDEAFCLDVVQEATLRIVRSVREMDEAPYRAWLVRVIHTTALDMLRAEARRVVREHKAADLRARNAHDTRPDHPAILASDLERITTALAALPAQDRSMLLARMIQSFPFARIASREGLTTQATYGRIKRLIADLRSIAQESPDHRQL